MNSTVQYLLEGIEIPLKEGIANSTKSHFTGVDNKLVHEIRNELDALKLRKQRISKERKIKILAKIDDAIDNSNRIMTHATAGHAVAGAALSHFTNGWSDLGYLAGRMLNSNDRAAFRETLYDLRAEVKALQTA